ncbi:uncharacterized protein KLLA0_D08833g [Kluyveromyces lactis]|uniref:KLLA0D08833p n=1 Tax=Kluyveromyces lactis (strain ATCC 8585 / CBS 2359 / DSM 70799 / NBRC 1267 / NRRL Y-1140 / WM37) TaxID=284590 RepID=Q6CRI3_KLULA|nr:uncharacterized protein KLLA0_D08833g [Kluyveromyces lactis]CAH00552.2 KLLA0D08833p [Kluyveromyces lactis]|eukprot:XP_453456.2 uncharacterized protein KLLA0_D08833g [Kluyveromyces lactis]
MSSDVVYRSTFSSASHELKMPCHLSTLLECFLEGTFNCQVL